MWSFRLYLYRMPPLDCESNGSIQVQDKKLTTWRVQNIERGQFDSSFEEVVERFSELPQMFIEPDGAFVWTGRTPTQRWQIDGILYDFGGRLSRVEIQGKCPEDDWNAFVRCLQPEGDLMAYWIDVQQFIKLKDLNSLWEAAG